MRISSLAFLALILMLLGCSGGGGGGSAAAPTSSETGSLSLRVDLSQFQGRGVLTTLLIRVVDADETERDVVAPISLTLGKGPTVQQTITNIAAGQRRVRLVALDDEGLELGRSLSEAFAISPNLRASLTVQVPLGSPSPTPTPSIDQLRFRTQPAGTLVGQVLTPAVQVELVDSDGNLLSSAQDAVTLTLTGAANLNGTATVNAVNGVATFANLSVDQAGTGFVLSASASNFTGATSDPFDIATSVGPPAQLAIVAQPTAGVAGQILAPPLQIVVQDAAGITVPTASTPVSVAFGSNPGGGPLGGTVSVVPSGGVATFADLQVNVPGAGYTLVGSFAGVPDVPSTPFNVTAAGTQLVFGTQPSPGQARAALTAFTVEIQDALGNVDTSSTATVTLSLASNPGPATLSGTLSVAAVNGVATFSNVVLSKSGTGYTLQAVSPGLTTAVSTTFDQSLPRGFVLPLAGFPVGGFNQPLRGDMTSDGSLLYLGEFGLAPGQVRGYSVSATGALTEVVNSPFVSGGNQVGGFAIFPDDTGAVAVNSNSSTVTRFALNLGTGDLTGSVNAGTGGNPLDLVIREGTTRTAYIFNFVGNTVSAIDLTSMTAVSGSGSSTGAGVTQSGVLHPNNNFLVANTGAVFSINPATGGITAVPGSPFASAAGLTVAFDPTGTFLYSAQNGAVAVHSFNPATGFLTPIAGSPFAAMGNLTGARVVLNGEFLYAGDNVTPNMHIFALDPTTGVPTELDDSPANVGSFFDIIVDPLERFVYITDQPGNQVRGFSIIP